ncbi:hypothetical protein L2E82_28590 [Cichorium intybus]|uniref:Uncharacterized protein n=1 Tax=Cichorium intybus TaxID=13427 RepID=A0ACB9CW58_CICIN|nr:hypothetical protein L2E82_28590 [Cichorium intybus]
MKSSKLITWIDPSVGVTAGMGDLGEVKVDLIEREENRGEAAKGLYSLRRLLLCILKCFDASPSNLALPSRIPVGGLLLHPQSMEKNLLTVTVLKFIKDLNPLSALPKLEIKILLIFLDIRNACPVCRGFNSDTLIGLVIVNITFQGYRTDVSSVQ